MRAKFLLYFDACAIIEMREKPTRVGKLLTDLVVNPSDAPYAIVTSELSLLEVLVPPVRGLVDRQPADEDETARALHDWYNDNLVADSPLIATLSIDRSTLIRSALLRARIKSLKAPDAIHIATALNHGVTHFVTQDARVSAAIGKDQLWQVNPSFRLVPMVELHLQQLIAELEK